MLGLGVGLLRPQAVHLPLEVLQQRYLGQGGVLRDKHRRKRN